MAAPNPPHREAPRPPSGDPRSAEAALLRRLERAPWGEPKVALLRVSIATHEWPPEWWSHHSTASHDDSATRGPDGATDVEAASIGEPLTPAAIPTEAVIGTIGGGPVAEPLQAAASHDSAARPADAPRPDEDLALGRGSAGRPASDGQHAPADSGHDDAQPRLPSGPPAPLRDHRGQAAAARSRRAGRPLGSGSVVGWLVLGIVLLLVLRRGRRRPA
jgi:hypothetical protein